MADDVASFFKSKKSKKHGPGQRGHGTVQTPDALARRLERTVQQQQVVDRENDVEENEDESQPPRPVYSQQTSASGGGGGTGGGGEQNNEESEWLDIQEQPEIDIAKIGIKELEIREESDGEANEDEESLSNRKTWNIPGQQQEKQPQKQKVTYAAGMDVDDGEEGISNNEKAAVVSKTDDTEKKSEVEDTEASKAETDKESEVVEKVQKYVPPSMRNRQLASAARATPWAKKPNIEDSVEFPSLAAAGELEAEIEKSKKKKPQPPLVKKSTSPAPVYHAPSPTPATNETPHARPADSTPAPPASAAAASEPAPETKPAAYVPPHLRKRAGPS